MAISQNGWTANDATLVSRRQVPGTNIWLSVRKGAPGDLLLEVAAQFDHYVQDIDYPPGDDWGYAERPIRGGIALSNHASGTAIDLNATRWPLGSNPLVNLSSAQIQRLRQILSSTGGVVRWGGDYDGRKDPMHFEINNGRTYADCVNALAALQRSTEENTNTWSSGTYCQKGDRGDRVWNLQKFLTRVYPRYNPYVPNGYYGDGTTLGVKAFQSNVGITGPDANGTIVGPATMRALIQNGFRP